MLDSKNISLFINGEILQGQKDLAIMSDKLQDIVTVKGILLEKGQLSSLYSALSDDEEVKLSVSKIKRDSSNKIYEEDSIFQGDFKVIGIDTRFDVVDLDLNSPDIVHPEYSIVFEG